MLKKSMVISTITGMLCVYSTISFSNERNIQSKNEKVITSVKKMHQPLENNSELETITITASKRKKSLQHIPITVNALNTQDIIDQNVVNMEDILTLFPNLSSNATTELISGFSMRGIGTNNPHGNINQAVGIYRDEISYGNPFSGILGVYDTERIEVLKGPQNSLFGRNTIGGAVHYLSTKPSIGDDHTTGYFLTDIGKFNQKDFTGAINIPLGEQVAFRFSGQSLTRDGIYKNLATNSAGNQIGEPTLGNKNRQSTRMQLLWQPTEYTSLLFNFHHAKHRGTNIGNRAYGTRDSNDPFLLINGAQDYRDDTLADNPASISPFIDNINANKVLNINSVDRNGFNPATGDWHNIYNVSSARSYANISGGFIKLEHQFDQGYRLNFTASTDQTEIESADEVSGTNSLQFIPNRVAEYKQQSYDLRVLSPDDQSIRWLAGVYAFKEDMDLYTIVRRFNYIGPQGNVPRDIAAHNILEQEDKDFSLYTNIEWDLSQKFTLSSGLRYTENKKEADSRFGVAANYNTNPSGGGSRSAMPFNTTTDLLFDRVPLDAFLGKTFIENCYSATFTDCTVLPPTISQFQLEQHLTEWGGRIALDYQKNNDQLIYVSYARGFKSGGFDTRALAALFGEGAEQAFLPEFLNAYELGLKTKLNPSLQINSAIFYNFWNNLQTFGVFNGEPKYVNIPHSITKGIESEIKWKPNNTWFAQLGIGLLDTEITDNGSLSAADVGHELPNSPAVTLNVLLKKHIRLASGLLTLQTDARYVSKQVDGLTFDADQFATKNTQLWLNARANYQFGNESQYNVALWAKNLTKETYCIDIGMQNIIMPNTTKADAGPRGIDLTSTISCQPSATSGERFLGVSLGINFY